VLLCQHVKLLKVNITLEEIISDVIVDVKLALAPDLRIVMNVLLITLGMVINVAVILYVPIAMDLMLMNVLLAELVLFFMKEIHALNHVIGHLYRE